MLGPDIRPSEPTSSLNAMCSSEEAVDDFEEPLKSSSQDDSFNSSRLALLEEVNAQLRREVTKRRHEVANAEARLERPNEFWRTRFIDLVFSRNEAMEEQSRALKEEVDRLKDTLERDVPSWKATLDEQREEQKRKIESLQAQAQARAEVHAMEVQKYMSQAQCATEEALNAQQQLEHATKASHAARAEIAIAAARAGESTAQVFVRSLPRLDDQTILWVKSEIDRFQSMK